MFKPVKQKKVYQYVVEQIQNMILSGDLKKGDKLPAERELAEKLAVSRASVREALRALEIMGLLESRQGEGNFIKDSIGESFLEPLSLMFMLNNGKKEEILEFRKMIEVETTTLAAKKISKDDAIYLKEIMNKLKNSKDEKESAVLDKEFHYKIAQIADNSIALNLLNSIGAVMESFIENAREMILKGEDRWQLLTDQHQEICDALIAKDDIKAANAMRKHLNEINKAMLS